MQTEIFTRDVYDANWGVMILWVPQGFLHYGLLYEHLDTTNVPRFGLNLANSLIDLQKKLCKLLAIQQKEAFGSHSYQALIHESCSSPCTQKLLQLCLDLDLR